MRIQIDFIASVKMGLFYVFLKYPFIFQLHIFAIKEKKFILHIFESLQIIGKCDCFSFYLLSPFLLSTSPLVYFVNPFLSPLKLLFLRHHPKPGFLFLIFMCFFWYSRRENYNSLPHSECAGQSSVTAGGVIFVNKYAWVAYCMPHFIPGALKLLTNLFMW